MTAHQREILRHLFGCDNAKDTARRFGITERQVRRIRDQAKRRLGVRTEYELARIIMRPRRRAIPLGQEPLW